MMFGYGFLLGLLVAVVVHMVRPRPRRSVAPHPVAKPDKEFISDEIYSMVLPEVIEMPDGGWEEWDSAVVQLESRPMALPKSFAMGA